MSCREQNFQGKTKLALSPHFINDYKSAKLSTQKMSKGLGLEVKLFLIVAQGQTILYVMYWLS